MLDVYKELAIELQEAIAQFKRGNHFVSPNSNHRLRGAERHVLFLVYNLKNGDPVTVSEIADRMGVTLAAVTHSMNSLDDEGMIVRITNAEDRRVVLIKLTKKGVGEIKKFKKELSEKISALIETLGEEDSKNLIRIVKKISANYRLGKKI